MLVINNGKSFKMLLYSKGSKDTVINSEEIKQALFEVYEKIGTKKKVLAIPPDITRYHSRAGDNPVFISLFQGTDDRYLARSWNTLSHDRFRNK